MWPSLPPTKGVSGAASLGNKEAAAVGTEQLKTISNIDVKNEWRYSTIPTHLSCTKFPKIKDPSKNSKRQSCDRNQVSYSVTTISRGLSKKFIDNCDHVARDLFTPALQKSVCEASSGTEAPCLYSYYSTVRSRCQTYVGKKYFMCCGRRPWT